MKTIEELENDGILKEHNFKVYQEIEALFEKENRVALVQATGTGKSFVAIQWLFDNCLLNGKKVLYLTAYNTIKDQFNKNIENVSIDRAEVFKNMDEFLYQKLLQVDDADFEALKYDYIILDEFHRVGAEKWESAVKKLLAVNKDAKVLGLSATPVRFLDSGRDMATEIFDGNVVEGLTLAEAIEKGVLPKPEYHYGIYSLYDQLQNLEEKKKRIQNKVKREELEKFLGRARKKVQQADGLEEIFAKNIKVKDGRYILFCSNLEQVNEIKERIEGGLFNAVNDKVKLFEISYTQSSKAVLDQIDKFEKASDDSLKLMLAVDMLNEGVHVKDVDGCVMFRNTISPRIYLQQIGRVLSVGTKKTPVIFDISNNIKSLQTIADVFVEKDKEGVNPYKLEDYLPFKIDSENMEIYKLLARIDEIESFYSYSTEEWLDMAKRYAEKFGDLKILGRYRDDETGALLYYWTKNIRNEYLKGNKDVEDTIKQLQEMDPEFLTYTSDNLRNDRETQILRCVKEYYRDETAKDKGIPAKLKVIDPLTNEIVNLGVEIQTIKLFLKGNAKRRYSQALIEQLRKINENIFKGLEDKREEKENQILRCVEAFYADENNKNKTITKKLTMLDPVTRKKVSIGSQIGEIKGYLAGYGTSVFSKEFIQKLNEINVNILKSQDERKEERENQIIRCVKEFYKDGDMNKRIKQRQTIIDPLTNERVNIGQDIMVIKRFLNNGGDNKPSQRLINTLLEINKDIFKSESDFRKEREAQLLRCVKAFYADENNKGKHIPNNLAFKLFDAETGETVNVGAKISQIKMIVNGKKLEYAYSQNLIDELLKIDKDIFVSADEKRKIKEERILRCVTEFYSYEENKGKPITQGYVMVDPATKNLDKENQVVVNLGDEIHRIRRFIKGQGGRYSQELIDSINKIDNNALQTKNNKENPIL